MDDRTPTEGDDDLARRVAELEATVARLTAALDARPAATVPPLADLLATLGQSGSVEPSNPVAEATDAPTRGSDAGPSDGARPDAAPDDHDETRPDGTGGRVDRRRLLTRAGAVAAGAVLGGAAATVATASPAAAATGSFDTSTATPAVTATTTGNGAGPAIRAETTGTGSAIIAVGNTNSSVPVISASTTNGPAMSLTSTSPRPVLSITHTSALMSLAVECPESSVATYSVGKNFGVLGRADGPQGTGVSGGSEGGIAGVSGIGRDGAVGAAFASVGGIGTRTVGSQAQLSFRAEGAPTMPPPVSRTDAHGAGEMYFDDNNTLWVCVADGTPGTWRRIAGPATTGALTVLPSPVRVYDSRPGQSPFVAPQTKLAANTPRTGIALTTNSSGIPTDATAAIITVTVANTADGSPDAPGFLTVYPNGITRPLTSNLNWTTPGAVVANTTTVALGAGATIAAFACFRTDLIIDAIGYYR